MESSERPSSKVPFWRMARRGKVALSIALVLSLGTAGVFGSWAAWTVADSNASNTFSTAAITLDDSRGGSAGATTATGTTLFGTVTVAPGAAATTKCIAVRRQNTNTATQLDLSASLTGDAATLGGQLTMTAIYDNSGGAWPALPHDGSCGAYPGGNTAAGSVTDLTSWVGAGPYTLASPASVVWYKFTVAVAGTLTAGTCSTYCGKSVVLTLTWTLTAT